MKASMLKESLALTMLLSMKTSLFCYAGSSSSSSGPMDLSSENLDQLTEEKAVFLMFYDSGCDEDDGCQDMSDEWNILAKEWEGHMFGIIAQVDCNEEDAMPICDYFDIDPVGLFPQFYVGGSRSWEPYSGKYDLKSLQEFAKTHISKPICTAYNPEFCEGIEKEKLETVSNLSDVEFDELVTIAQSEMQELQNQFDELSQPLLAQQEQAIEEYKQSIETIFNQHHFKYIDQILRQRDKEESLAEME